MNIERLKALEKLESGLRVEMRNYFHHDAKTAVQHACETACCHAGWACVIAHANGYSDVLDEFGPCYDIVASNWLGLPLGVAEFLFCAFTHMRPRLTDFALCSEREGRLRLRILIELQSEDVGLLTAELQRRMAEPEATAVASEICEAVGV